MRIIGILILALVCSSLFAEENWPQFRGPGSLGAVEAQGLPTTWSTTDNVSWSTPVPGRGWSSPVVWGDRIFLTSVVSSKDPGAPKTGLYSGGPQSIPEGEHRWMVYALDWRSGRVVWEREVHRGNPDKARHLTNSYASETPVVDAERVYAYFGNLGVFAFDHDGEASWSKPLEHTRTRNGWGTAASPVLHEGRLYLVNDNEDASYILALDTATGKQIWRELRDEKSNWSTPFVWSHEGRSEIVTTGSNKIRSYGLSGKLLWSLSGMSTIAIPTPFSKYGLLYIASGYMPDDLRPVYAIRPGASGDISLEDGQTSNAFIAWHHPQGGPYNPSPLIYDDAYYTLYDRGFFTSHDARTGAVIYDKRRIDPVAGNFTTSPWAYDGKIFCLNEDGTTFVIRAGSSFEVLGKNDLDEVTLASPAILRDSLLIRTATKLYRIKSDGASSSQQ